MLEVTLIRRQASAALHDGTPTLHDATAALHDMTAASHDTTGALHDTTAIFSRVPEALWVAAPLPQLNNAAA